MSVGREKNVINKPANDLKVILKRLSIAELTSSHVRPANGTIINAHNDLKVILKRTPLAELTNTNNTMSANGTNNGHFPRNTHVTKNSELEPKVSKNIIKVGTLSIPNKSEHHTGPFPKSKQNTLIRNKLKKVENNCHIDKHPVPEKNPKKQILHSSEVTKCLRDRKTTNYAELTLEESPKEAPVKLDCTEKRPIYRQNLQSSPKSKIAKDLYEFNDFDPKMLKKFKKKPKANTSGKFDKTMHDILRKIEKKESKPKRQRVKKIKVNTYEKTVQSILKNVADKVNHRKVKGKSLENVENPAFKQKTVQILKSQVPKLPKVNECVVEKSSDTMVSNKLPLVAESTPKIIEMDLDNYSLDGFNHANDDNPSSDEEFFGFTEFESNHPKVCDFERSLNEYVVSASNIEDNHSHNTPDDKFFGFSEEEDPPDIPTKRNPRINIISNVPLNKSIHSPSTFNRHRPTANSSMFFGTNKKSSKAAPRPTEGARPADVPDIGTGRGGRSTYGGSRNRSPWRFGQNVTRNRHFLTIKSTALPALHQDLVLDWTQVEKIEEHFSKTPRRMGTPTKSPVQQSVLRYITSTSHTLENQENIPQSFLFDVNDYSPIKTRTQTRSENKTVNRAKRNILSPINDNIPIRTQAVSTPLREIVNKVASPDMSIITRENRDVDDNTYFGFDSGDEGSSGGRATKSPRAVPARFDATVLRKYAKKPRKAEAAAVVIRDLTEEVVADSGGVVDASGDGDVDMWLFDDPENDFPVEMPSEVIIKKRQRRVRTVDSQNSDEDKPRKKRKDKKRQAEEDELEKWAAAFNSMCAEVEKHQLEIE